jgi:hypothetical protein
MVKTAARSFNDEWQHKKPEWSGAAEMIRLEAEQSEEYKAARAFVAAAAELLNVVDHTIFEIRQGREETRMLLDQLETLLGPSND